MEIIIISLLENIPANTPNFKQPLIKLKPLFDNSPLFTSFISDIQFENPVNRTNTHLNTLHKQWLQEQDFDNNTRYFSLAEDAIGYYSEGLQIIYLQKSNDFKNTRLTEYANFLEAQSIVDDTRIFIDNFLGESAPEASELIIPSKEYPEGNFFTSEYSALSASQLTEKEDLMLSPEEGQKATDTLQFFATHPQTEEWVNHQIMGGKTFDAHLIDIPLRSKLQLMYIFSSLTYSKRALFFEAYSMFSSQEEKLLFLESFLACAEDKDMRKVLLDLAFQPENKEVFKVYSEVLDRARLIAKDINDTNTLPKKILSYLLGDTNSTVRELLANPGDKDLLLQLSSESQAMDLYKGIQEKMTEEEIGESDISLKIKRENIRLLQKMCSPDTTPQDRFFIDDLVKQDLIYTKVIEGRIVAASFVYPLDKNLSLDDPNQVYESGGTSSLPDKGKDLVQLLYEINNKYKNIVLYSQKPSVQSFVERLKFKKVDIAEFKNSDEYSHISTILFEEYKKRNKEIYSQMQYIYLKIDPSYSL